MTFAAAQNGGVRTLAASLFLGWSVTATAQSAPVAPAKEGAAPAKAPAAPAKEGAAPAKAPATPVKAQAAPTTAPAAPAKAAAPAGAAKATTAPVANKTATAAGTPPKAAAEAPKAADGSPPAGTPPTPTGTGESWVKAPAGQPSTTPSSPWPDAAAAADPNGAPPVYYVEQAPNPTAAPGAPPPSDEAEPPMRLQIEEPPPPPVPRHRAPKTALWLGARVGYFIPFGDLWGRCSSSGYSSCDSIEGAKFSDVAATGPMFELDIGVRLGRHYVVYLGWERAQLGAAGGPSPDSSTGNQLRGESDYLAVGVRLSADPDDIGLLLDLSIGARRFRGLYQNDVELQLSDAPLESRLGIGIDIRTHRSFSLSPMLTLGLGSFGKAEWVTPTTVQTAVPSDADRLTHGWVTLQLGGHFDIAGGG